MEKVIDLDAKGFGTYRFVEVGDSSRGSLIPSNIIMGEN